MPLRYPTEKAYGVNLAYTSQAFRNLGHDVVIYNVGENTRDFLGNPVVGIMNTRIRMAQSLQRSGKKIISKIGFYFLQIAFSMEIPKIRSLSNSGDLIITRFPIVASWAILFKNWKNVFLELHHIPNFFEFKLMSYVGKNLKTVVTNSFFCDELVKEGFSSSIFVIPNAAPDSFFQVSPRVFSTDQKINIGYAGKATSSGHDNGLDIVLRLFESFPEVSQKVQFTLIGCEESFTEKINQHVTRGLIPLHAIKNIIHLEHSKLLEFVSKFHLALIPYPESNYYAISFPIKIVEMAAAGIPMLASDTVAHRRILGQTYKFYFEPGSELSLKELIDRLLCDRFQVNEESKRLKEFAKSFTYMNRARKIIELNTN